MHNICNYIFLYFSLILIKRQQQRKQWRLEDNLNDAVTKLELKPQY